MGIPPTVLISPFLTPPSSLFLPFGRPRNIAPASPLPLTPTLLAWRAAVIREFESSEPTSPPPVVDPFSLFFRGKEEVGGVEELDEGWLHVCAGGGV